jgi:anti-sigma B factor antagonist
MRTNLLDAECDRTPGEVTLRLRGELDIATAGKFLTELGVALRGGHERLVIDLRELALLDSAGVRALVHARRRMWRRGGEAVLLCGEGAAARTLRLMGLYESLNCE